MDDYSSRPNHEENNVPPVNQTEPQTNSYENFNQPNTQQTNNTAYSQSGYNTPDTGADDKHPNEYSPSHAFDYDSRIYDYYNNNNSTATKKKSKAGLITFISLITVCVIVTCISLAYAFNSSSKSTDSAKNNNSKSETTTGHSNLTISDSDDVLGNSEVTAAVAEKVAPSVVAITVTTKDPNSYSFYSNGSNSSVSAGSGFIIQSENGYSYIATNYHVVEAADVYAKYTVISVMLDDGTEYEAQYVAGDSKNDIAVIKVKADNLTVAELGNSDKLTRGEFVMAIGNPLGKDLEGSVSLGIISGTGRTVSEGSSVPFIQTDAAINSGNSGGPLVNMNGQVVGINTAKVQAEGYEGLGFSIPMSYAEPILSELIKTGKAPAYACIGIQYTFISDIVSQNYNVPVGLQIASINDGSKIDRNTVKIGDIITKVDGKEIKSASTITELLNGKKPGDKITLTLYRPNSGNGSTFETTVTLVSNEDLSQESTTQQQQRSNGYGY